MIYCLNSTLPPILTPLSFYRPFSVQNDKETLTPPHQRRGHGPACCSRSDSYHPVDQHLRPNHPIARHNVPLLGPFHDVVVGHEGRDNVENASLESAPGVEDGSVSGTGERLLLVAGKRVGGNSLLLKTTKVAPPTKVPVRPGSRQ